MFSFVIYVENFAILRAAFLSRNNFVTCYEMLAHLHTVHKHLYFLGHPNKLHVQGSSTNKKTNWEL